MANMSNRSVDVTVTCPSQTRPHGRAGGPPRCLRPPTVGGYLWCPRPRRLVIELCDNSVTDGSSRPLIASFHVSYRGSKRNYRTFRLHSRLVATISTRTTTDGSLNHVVVTSWVARVGGDVRNTSPSPSEQEGPPVAVAVTVGGQAVECVVLY
jgi:hypothetical protein